MDGRLVRELEHEIELALESVLDRLSSPQSPLRLESVPDRRILHLMAKAAVTVLEASVPGK